jgi:hypothetical protein
VGVHPVVIRVNDGTVNADQTFSITVINTNDPPTFTSIPLTSGTQDLPYSYTATVDDDDVGDVLALSSPTLPAWLTFTPATGLLTGTPSNAEVGIHPVIIRVNDGTVSVDQSFSINVANVNDAPAFTSIPDQTAIQDVPYSYTATGIDIDGDSVIFSAPTLPAWLTFNDTTRVLSGTPGNAEVGIHNVTLRISDGLLSQDQPFVIEVANVNDAPTFTSLPLTTATQDALYSYTVTALDLDGDSIIYSATILPAWLSFNDATQILSGTPGNDDVGTDTVALRITDGTATTDQGFVITIGNMNDAPQFTSIPNTTATQDSPYSYIVTAIDIDGDNMIFSAPTIPAWLTFNLATRALSGTPGDPEVGDHPVTIRVNDGAVDVDQSFIITVENINDAPTYITVPNTSALQDSPYTSTVIAEDVDGDSIIFSAPVLPPWLSFNDNTRVLSGTPGNDHVGNNTLTLRISDGLISVDSTIVIVVGNVNDAPTFLAIPDTEALQDDPYSSGLSAEDIDGDILIYTAPTLPAWLTFNSVTNTLNGTPGNDDVGDHSVTLRISDGLVEVDTTFIISVENVNDPPTFLSSPNETTLEDVLYSYTVIAEDIDGDAITYSAPVIPAWLSMNLETNVLSGTPGNEHVGMHSIALTISDGVDEVVQAFSIEVVNVNDPPEVTSTPVTEARPGVAYSYTVTAVDIDGDALTYTALVLPGWLTFNSGTQTLSATPGEEDEGDQHVTIRISDGIANTDHTFVISVGFANHAPVFTSEPETNVTAGSSYVYTITAQDIDGDELTFSAPLLPDWLSFSPESNVISGTPQNGDIGRHDVTVRVSDGTVSADQSFPIFVENVNSAPTFISVPVNSVRAGELYVYYAEADDSDADDLIFSAPVKPDWLDFEADTRALFGVPTNADAGDHNVTLRVYDGEETVDQNFVITVEFVEGIAEIASEEGILVYPNPTDGRFFVEFSQELDTEVTLEILDNTGRVINQEVFPPYYLIFEEYNLNEGSPGIYFIRIYDNSSQVVKKLLLH